MKVDYDCYAEAGVSALCEYLERSKPNATKGLLLILITAIM